MTAPTEADASEPLRELWDQDEFRKSETEAWGNLIERVYQRADKAFSDFLLEELTRVGVEFAELHPDAARPTMRLVPA